MNRIKRALHKTHNEDHDITKKESLSPSRVSQETVSTNTPSLSIDRTAATPIGAANALEKPKAFVLQENVLRQTGHPYTVRDLKGDLFYQVHGRKMILENENGMDEKPMKQRMMISDVDGLGIYEIKEKTLSLHHRLKIESVKSGETLLTLRRKSSTENKRQIKTVLVWKNDDQGQEPWLSIRGDFKAYEYVIVNAKDDTKIAVVKHNGLDSTKVKTKLDAKEYLVKVMPGNDVPLLLMLVVAIDEFYQPGRSVTAIG